MQEMPFRILIDGLSGAKRYTFRVLKGIQLSAERYTSECRKTRFRALVANDFKGIKHKVS